MDVKKEILKNKVVLMLLCGRNYENELFSVIKNLGSKKICYVSVNKGYSFLNREFRRRKISTKNMFFIDCITRSLIDAKNQEDVDYISTPTALTDINLEVSEAIRKGYEVIIIDSISNLSIYHNHDVLCRFVDHVAAEVRAKTTTGLVLFMTKDETSQLIKKIQPLVDKVIEI